MPKIRVHAKRLLMVHGLCVYAPRRCPWTGGIGARDDPQWGGCGHLHGFNFLAGDYNWSMASNLSECRRPSHGSPFHFHTNACMLNPHPSSCSTHPGCIGQAYPHVCKQVHLTKQYCQVPHTRCVRLSAKRAHTQGHAHARMCPSKPPCTHAAHERM